MSDLNEMDKLRVLLPHWIEHNRAHGGEFALWAEKAGNSGHEHGEEIAASLAAAVSACEQVTAALEEAMKAAGGPLEHVHHDHSHQHGHSH